MIRYYKTLNLQRAKLLIISNNAVLGFCIGFTFAISILFKSESIKFAFFLFIILYHILITNIVTVFNTILISFNFQTIGFFFLFQILNRF